MEELKIHTIDGKIVLNNWGVFEKKEVKVRKIVTPQMKEAVIIEAKKKIWFRTGTGLQDAVNGIDADE